MCYDLNRFASTHVRLLLLDSLYSLVRKMAIGTEPDCGQCGVRSRSATACNQHPVQYHRGLSFNDCQLWRSLGNW